MRRFFTLLIGATLLSIADGAFDHPSNRPISIPPAVCEAEAEPSHGVSVKVGTLGIGIDFEHMFNRKHGVRLNINGIKANRDEEFKESEYSIDLQLLTAGVLYDFHPRGDSFRLSTGVYYNNNQFGTATTYAPVTVSSILYKPDEVGTIDAKVDFNSIAPYIGVGWSSTSSNGWSFVADFGVIYAGRPRIWAETTVGSAIDAIPESKKIEILKSLNKTIEYEKRVIYNDIKDYKWWPVVMIGVQKRF